jgi:2-polyprenyl-3-methyl-5-hydroxy-6-metoxy-1,4-benzoquinol methylase
MINTQTCEVCGSTDLKEVLNLGKHPLCDDLIPVDNESISNQYPIEILLCTECLTAHQKFQVPKHELFPKSYHYRSRFTQDVLNGMKNLAANVDASLPAGVRDKVILDIGSNDGSLLNYFKDLGAITVGVEPTDAAIDTKSHFVYQKYFDLETAKEIKLKFGYPDVITFTNVFAHIENLHSVLDSLNHLIGFDTLIVIENHYLGSILEKNQFDTFYHEHPRTYSANSFKFIARNLKAKINLISFTERYGGNIQVYLSRGREELDFRTLHEVFENEKLFPLKFNRIEKSISIWKTKTSLLLNNLNSIYGAIPAKAFPGRAAILIKLLNINEKQICAVYEKPGSQKIGNYVPGTRIPIKSDLELNDIDQDLPIINLSWHIADEISKYLSDLNYKGKIINIIDSDSFT